MLHMAHYHHHSGLYSILSRGHVLCHLCPMFSGACSVQKHLRELWAQAKSFVIVPDPKCFGCSMVKNIIDYSIWLDISHMSYQKKNGNRHFGTSYPSVVKYLLTTDSNKIRHVQANLCVTTTYPTTRNSMYRPTFNHIGSASLSCGWGAQEILSTNLRTQPPLRESSILESNNPSLLLRRSMNFGSHGSQMKRSSSSSSGSSNNNNNNTNTNSNSNSSNNKKLIRQHQ